MLDDAFFVVNVEKTPVLRTMTPETPTGEKKINHVLLSLLNTTTEHNQLGFLLDSSRGR